MWSVDSGEVIRSVDGTVDLDEVLKNPPHIGVLQQPEVRITSTVDEQNVAWFPAGSSLLADIVACPARPTWAVAPFDRFFVLELADGVAYGQGVPCAV